MLSRRNVIENHLKQVQALLAFRMKQLTERQLDPKAQKRDVTVRKYKAEVSQYKRRLAALDKVDAVNADLATRRVERAEKAKLPKEKKKRAAPVVAKGKGGGEKKQKKAAAE